MTFKAFYVGSATEINSDSHLDLLAPLTLIWIQVSFDGVSGIARVYKIYIYIHVHTYKFSIA